MGKFKVGDMVVIARPMIEEQECYRGFIRRVFEVDPIYDGLYYFEDIRTEDGDDLCAWDEKELDLVNNITETDNLRIITTCNGVKVELRNDRDNELYKCHILAKSYIESTEYESYCMEDTKIINTYCEKIKEEKDMNKVVTLWYERKRKSIEKKYDKLREEFGEKQYSVAESFNELVEQFNRDLDDLFQYDKASEQFVLVNNAPNNVIKYKIDVNKLDEEFNEMYRDEIRKAYKKIDDTREEVEAQLSLSDDLKYQQEVLERYNIISKKTKKISD